MPPSQPAGRTAASHGACAVAACRRPLAAARDTYCDTHLQRLRLLRRGGGSVEERAWRRTEPPVTRAGQVSLLAISPDVAVEVLFGVQQRTRLGVKTSDAILRSVCSDLRRQQVQALAD